MKKEFSSCSLSEISKFQKNGNKVNAHAGMPFCGISRFAMPASQLVFGHIDQGQQPFGGVGRLRLSFLGFAEPHLGKCNDSRPFLYSDKIWQNRRRIGEKLQWCKLLWRLLCLKRKMNKMIYKQRY